MRSIAWTVLLTVLMASVSTAQNDSAASVASTTPKEDSTVSPVSSPSVSYTLEDARITGWEIKKKYKAAKDDAAEDETTEQVQREKSIDFGDTLVVSVEHLAALISAKTLDPEKVIMHWDEVSLAPIAATYCCLECDELTFVINKRYLSNKTTDKIKTLAGLSDQDVGISLFLGQSPWLNCCSPALKVHLRTFRKNLIWSIFFSAGLLLLLLWLARKTGLLRGAPINNDPNQRPYSLSRVQLAFWTFIILSSFFYIYIATGQTQVLNNTALILLGISSATAAIAQTIDTGDQRNTKLRGLSRNQKGSNWLINILSDEQGISIHRLQTVIFNFVFGIIYVNAVLSTLIMPDFSTEQLMLLGISNATYSALKTNETSNLVAAPVAKDEPAQATAPPTNPNTDNPSTPPSNS